MLFTSKVVKFGCAGLLLMSLVLVGWGCAKQGEITPSAEQTEEKSAADLEKEQMFEAAREYIKRYSVEGMEVDLEIIKQLDKWVLLRVIPLNIETDTAAIVLEKVGDKWVAREFGTILPESTEKVPELFKLDLEEENAAASQCTLNCPVKGYELDKVKCKCVYQGVPADDCLQEKAVEREDFRFIGCYCPQEYGLAGGGGLGYKELIEGVNKVEWTSENTLKVTAVVYINCALGLKDADYKIEGDDLILTYKQTSAGDKPLVACACPHGATYIISNLEKKDYNVKMGR